MPKKSAYGNCAICEAQISIPGLDGYLCSGCGWKKFTEVEMLLKKKARRAKKLA